MVPRCQVSWFQRPLSNPLWRHFGLHMTLWLWLCWLWFVIGTVNGSAECVNCSVNWLNRRATVKHWSDNENNFSHTGGWPIKVSPFQWRRNEFESGGTGPASEKNCLVMPLSFFGSKSTISHLVSAFVMVSTDLVSFLFAVLLLRVPPLRSQPFVKVEAPIVLYRKCT